MKLRIITTLFSAAVFLTEGYAQDSLLNLHKDGTGLQIPLSIANFSNVQGDLTGIRFKVNVGNSGDDVRYKGGIFFERVTSNGRGSLHFANNGQNGTDNVGTADIRMTIERSGDVGIGTTNPTELLHVAGRAKFDDRIRLLHGTTGGLDFGSSWLSYATSTNDAFVVTHSGTGGAELEIRNINGNHADSHFLVGGKMGIDTNPNYPLEVRGIVSLLPDGNGTLLKLDGSGSSFYSDLVSGENDALIYTSDWSSGNRGDLIMSPRSDDNSGNTRDVVITHSDGSGNIDDALVVKGRSGNVGIGSTNPDSRLEIVGALGDAEMILRSTDANPDLRFNAESQEKVGLLYDRNDNAFEIHVDDSGMDFTQHSLVVKDGGNVGVGTSNPASPLHIKQPSFNGLRFERAGHDTYDIRLAGSKGLRVYNITSGSYEMAFDDGRVGIGTIDIPSGYKLAVAGKAIAEEVKVELSGSWPDYVFEEGYHLPTLESLEAFIKSEKHLPEIPSAAEMEENGLELGTMNMLLLKKIEELTLHTIQQSKEIQNLQFGNDQLRVKNDELSEGLTHCKQQFNNELAAYSLQLEALLNRIENLENNQ